jgi:hypothetical protein
MGGALNELKRIVVQFDAAAAREGLTPPQAAGRLEQNAEPLAREQGQDMVQTIARADRFEEELEEMQSAGPLKRIGSTSPSSSRLSIRCGGRSRP